MSCTGQYLIVVLDLGQKVSNFWLCLHPGVQPPFAPRISYLKYLPHFWPVLNLFWNAGLVQAENTRPEERLLKSNQSLTFLVMFYIMLWWDNYGPKVCIFYRHYWGLVGNISFYFNFLNILFSILTNVNQLTVFPHIVSSLE